MKWVSMAEGSDSMGDGGASSSAVDACLELIPPAFAISSSNC